MYKHLDRKKDNKLLEQKEKLHSDDESKEDDDDNKEMIVKLRNIHKTYLLGLEGVPALRGVSLKVYKGEFIVILGKSGGGKTSMLNIMGTIDKPTKGDLYIENKRISNNTTDSELANIRLKKIGFCFQTFNLISSMTALENVELPMILDGTLSSTKIRSRGKLLLSSMGLSDRLNHLPSQLSGGEQQRVTIARAIANKPSLLLLDEPTGDLDTKNSNNVLDIIINLNVKQNITCIFVTHDVALKYYANRVIHMLDGKISKIEHIPKYRREQAIKELKYNLNKGVEKSIDQFTQLREPNKYYNYLRWKTKYFDNRNSNNKNNSINNINNINENALIQQNNSNNNSNMSNNNNSILEDIDLNSSSPISSPIESNIN